MPVTQAEIEAACQAYCGHYRGDSANSEAMKAALEAAERARWQPIETAPIIGEIAAERSRQVEVERWNTEHDDDHIHGELGLAAACYVLGSANHWPWDLSWWRPSSRRRDLIKGAALIVAEIERLDRVLQPLPSPPESK